MPEEEKPWDKYKIDIGTMVKYKDFEAVVVDKYLQHGQYVCEINYVDSGDTDHVYMSQLQKI